MENECDGKLRIGAIIDLKKIALIFVFLTAISFASAQAGDGSLALVQAADSGDMASIKALLESGVTADAKDTAGETALVHAARNGHTEVVEALLEKGAHINAHRKDGMTPLMEAAWNGHLETVKILLAKNADADLRTKAGKTASYLAAQQGYQKIRDLIYAKENPRGGPSKEYLYYEYPWFLNPGVTFTSNGVGGEMSLGCYGLMIVVFGGVLQYEPAKELFNRGVEIGFPFFLVEMGYSTSKLGSSNYIAPTLSLPFSNLKNEDVQLYLNVFYRHYFDYRGLNSVGAALKIWPGPIFGRLLSR